MPLLKQPGLKEFKPDPKDETLESTDNPSSRQIAEKFLETEESLRMKLQEALQSGNKDAKSIESDLADFYKNIENKYGKRIVERQDFIDLMEVVSNSDSVYNEAVETMQQMNKKRMPYSERETDSGSGSSLSLQKAAKRKTFEETDTSSMVKDYDDKRKFKRFRREDLKNNVDKINWNSEVGKRKAWKDKFSKKKDEVELKKVEQTKDEDEINEQLEGNNIY